ncbi:Ketopantoate reductase ApbA/PanE [Penicillium canariense]|uniref:2-dehydropantoate 2-reductase n=1 Tax=Penicillium canariense TaxID=189055 RepID=A0A9W9LEB6_9EURO|nr:Ketopantoate reductase ApbA/PanE [Penicillium canariense]KAJ5151102.1 Ketopantoate reductase ApbA/PanE [Penicillium canariense]
MGEQKARVLIVGTGGVGTLAAYALEQGGKAEVTAVMRSNYNAVQKNGISINSAQYGNGIKGWRPTRICKVVPNTAKENLPPFDFILVTTKNIPEISPTVSDIIAPAVTPHKTAIVLCQNGINIEKPLISCFPTNPIISSVSYVSATEISHGSILHDGQDEQTIGAFHNPDVPAQVAEEAAKRYIDIYNPDGKIDVTFDADVRRVRWRKLLYNASFNPVAAILRMDTPRMRMSSHVIDDLIRPIMKEVLAAARADGITDFPEDLPEILIRVDPIGSAFKPSMCQDIEKGNLIELENIVGEPLREGESKGVAMPTLRTIYGLLKGMQLKVKESKGMWEPKFGSENPYQ